MWYLGTDAGKKAHGVVKKKKRRPALQQKKQAEAEKLDVTLFMPV